MDIDTTQYDNPGISLEIDMNREVLYRNNRTLFLDSDRHTGKVTSTVCVSRDGRVIYVEVNNRETNSNNNTIENVLKALYGYRFTPSQGGSTRDCGTITINFDKLKRESDSFENHRLRTGRRYYRPR